MRQRHSSPRGVTLVECLGFCLIAAALFAMTCVMSVTLVQRSRDAADQDRLRRIHTGMVAFARAEVGRLPRPGLIDRIACGLAGPGYGDEDHSQNHTAFVYSAMVSHLLIEPGALISPNEVNERVFEKPDYDFTAYRPIEDVFWDRSFVADIANDGRGSNVSYAHLVLAGERVNAHWRDLSSAITPLVGTRAPRNGVSAGLEYARSPTLRWTGSVRSWDGFVVFGDNHADRLTSVTLQGLTYDPFGQGSPVPDNMYDCEFNDGAWGDPFHAAGDIWLGMTIPQHCEFRVTPEWDPLD